jgi:hypothetical protein
LIHKASIKKLGVDVQLVTGFVKLDESGESASENSTLCRRSTAPHHTEGFDSGIDTGDGDGDGDGNSDDEDDDGDAIDAMDTETGELEQSLPRRWLWEPLEEQRLLAWRREKKEWQWIFEQLPHRKPGAIRTRHHMLERRERA